MAVEVAEHLAAHDIVHVVSSPLERAIETARPTADSHGLGIHVDGRLIEAGNFFEGKVVGVGDGVLRHPEYWSKLRDPFTPSWGEAYAAIAARMLGAIDAARDAARGHEALVVSHQLPVWTARSRLEGRRLWHDPCTTSGTSSSQWSIASRRPPWSAMPPRRPARDLDADSMGRGARPRGCDCGARCLPERPQLPCRPSGFGESRWVCRGRRFDRTARSRLTWLGAGHCGRDRRRGQVVDD